MYVILLLHSKYVYLLFFQSVEKTKDKHILFFQSVEKLWIKSWKGYARKVFLMHEWSLSLNCFSFKVCLSFVFQMLKNCESIVEKDMYAKGVLDAWMKSEFRTNFGVLNHREGTAKGDFLAMCLCFVLNLTHTLWS